MQDQIGLQIGNYACYACTLKCHKSNMLGSQNGPVSKMHNDEHGKRNELNNLFLSI